MKIALALCAIAGTAAAAQAITVTSEPIGSSSYSDRALTTVYTGIPGPYAAFATRGNIGFDDYQTSNVTDLFTTIGSLRFVGGIQVAGGTIDFNFYDATGTVLVNSFNVNFGANVGNFVYTINLGTVANGNMDSTFVIPTAGVLQLGVRAGSTGQWFLTPTLPTIGTNTLAYGGGSPTRNNAFELNAVPAPGALALLGLGGVVAARRRR